MEAKILSGEVFGDYLDWRAGHPSDDIMTDLLQKVVLEEILKRFPEWEVDTAAAKLSPTSTVRGWESLPVVIPAA
jgi:hypothetical protein